MISHMIISKLKKPNSVLNRFRFNNIAGSEELIAQCIDISVTNLCDMGLLSKSTN